MSVRTTATDLGTGETVSVLVHIAALRAADKELQAERDRRYAEVAEQRDKALKIKEEADKVALDLARQIQTYKDEKANELRSQIERERGSYATQQDLRGLAEKMEATFGPVLTFVATQQGRVGGWKDGYGYIAGAIGVAATIASFVR